MAGSSKRNSSWFATPPAKLIPLDEAAATELAADLAAEARDDAPNTAKVMAGRSAEASFIAAACDLSPFLRDALRRRPAVLEALSDTPVAARIDAIVSEIDALSGEVDLTEKDLMQRLRELKGDAHVLIALADLAREADSACDSGWIVLGMGKLGAGELNFSSDIDLVVFFDPQAPAILDPLDATELFARLTRRLVRILQDRTEHGYVFRTDLRLRPDPGSTPLAIPVEAALNYYEGRGQNWERAAMIKARPVAGDLEAGAAFLKELQPYVWRKYMDYAAIADVHSIKRQIHAHKGHGEIAVRGHNVKLGRGGIREVEFFVQTQQLIAGGRFPELRGRETVRMLGVLAERGWITEDARDALARRYWFLRDVEHAIQMVADEQTHMLPEDDEGLERIARLRGFESAEAFADELRKALKEVETHYAALFETAPALSTEVGNLVFTGDVDDPDTLKTLSGMGFERPSDIARIIRTWHFGRYRATQSAEARERLTELTPALLQAFGQTRRADEAILRFDEFLSGLPAGIQLFSLLQSNPRLLKMLADIMGAAPRLAATITRRAHVFDGLLDPGLLSELPTRTYLSDRLSVFLAGVAVHEEILDRLRIFADEQKFLIGVRLLTGAIDAVRAGKAFSDLADLTIGAALDAVMAEFRRRHGKVAGGRIVVLGMGKLGSRELTAGSDVDLILLYDHDEGAEESDGEKPLAAAHYFARLTQRLIAAVSAPTAEGVLYELDLRLRPSGNKGPVATHVDAFEKYQTTEAWTWEHMALTRARPVAGDEALVARVERIVADVMAAPRDMTKVRRDAREMRELIAKEKPPSSAWDLKLVPGGLIDLEFVAQVSTLERGGETGFQRATPTAEALSLIEPAQMDPQARQELVEAHGLYMQLTQIIRLCLTQNLDPDDIPPGLADLMLARTDLPEIGVLQAHIGETGERVAKIAAEFLRRKG